MRRRDWRRWGCAGAALSLLACGDGTRGGTAVLEDSAGVGLIRLPAADPSEPVTLSLDSTWRSLAGSEGELMDLRVRPDGRAVVLDGQSARVILLSPEGAPAAWIGRPGQGPGELEPRGLRTILVSDSSVLVPDLAQQRLSWFRWSGELASMEPFPGGGGYLVDWQWGSEGSLAYRSLDPRGDQVLQVSGAGVDTLHVFPSGDPRPNLLLPPVALWVLADEHLAVGTSHAWGVDVYDVPGGRHLWGVRRALEAEPVSRADRAHLTRVLEASMTRQTGGQRPSAEALDRTLAQVAFPEGAPLVAGLLFAPGGELWIRRAAPVSQMDHEALRVGSAEGYGGAVWDVVNPRGPTWHVVRLPSGFTPREFSGGYLYGLVLDRLGVRRPARVAAPRDLARSEATGGLVRRREASSAAS